MNYMRFYLFSQLPSMSFCACALHAATNTHTFLHMWCEFRCPVGRRTLTQCPVRESTVSLQAPTAGWLSVPRPARADSCSFPSPCSPTVEPCAASTFPECRRWRNDPALTSQTLLVCVCACVCVFSLSYHPSSPTYLSTRSFLSQRSGLFICSTFAPLLCLCFPSSLLSARMPGGL